MDNAAYHKRVEGLKGGIYSLRKAELVEWMERCKATTSMFRVVACTITLPY